MLRLTVLLSLALVAVALPVAEPARISPRHDDTEVVDFSGIAADISSRSLASVSRNDDNEIVDFSSIAGDLSV